MTDEKKTPSKTASETGQSSKVINVIENKSVDESLWYLKYEVHTKPEEFREHWLNTRANRLHFIQNITDTNNSDVFIKWPHYKKPDGYRMVGTISVLNCI